jgi:ribosomal protein S12 methylthiotransferase accessory factor
MSTPEITRKALRQSVMEAVNKLSRPELLEQFAISRIAELTHLDTIGLPVYSCTRALSQTISIHSGKGLEPAAARAGAILEAIEFEVAEHPEGPFKIATATQLPEEDRLSLEDCFPVRSSVVNEFTLIAWEEVTNIQTGASKLIPSDLVWMVPRIKHQPLMYFQMGTNGLASGGSLEDAILSGLYEVIERDAWTLNQFLLDNCGWMPTRSPLAGLPERLEVLVRKLDAAKVKLHLFDIATDYRVPVFGAILLDHSGQCAGTFGGYGCHINAEIAAIRAITEAAQSRCCYISGARDDLFRRQFLLMKRLDQSKLDDMFNELPLGNPLIEYRNLSFPDVRSELRYLLKLIKGHGVNQVFVKDMGSYVEGRVHVVRVLSPQCEPVHLDAWTPGLRCLSYAQRKLAAMKESKDKSEAWKDGS